MPARKSARSPAAAPPTPEPTPDVTFHKRMTAGKRALAASSPLDRLIAGGGREKRARDESQEGSATKRARAEDPAVARAALQEERRARKRAKKAAAKAEAEDGGAAGDEVGVVYVGHIPHGFYEKQMRSFFEQFGKVTRLRLSRSKKTARSRGFAFVEFANAEVAGIAAKAMDGYLMHGRALVAKLVAPEDVHPETFVGADRVFTRIPWAGIERKRNIDAARNPEKLASRAVRLSKHHEKVQQRLVAKGISYKFPKIVEVGSASVDVFEKSALEKAVPALKAPLDSEADAVVGEGVGMVTPKAASTPQTNNLVSKSGKKGKSARKAKKGVDEEVVDFDAVQASKEVAASIPKASVKSSKAATEAETAKKVEPIEVASASMDVVKKSALEKAVPALKAPLDSEADVVMDEVVGLVTPKAASTEQKNNSVPKSGKKGKSARKAKKGVDEEVVDLDAALSSKEVAASTPKASVKSSKAAAKVETAKKVESIPTSGPSAAADAAAENAGVVSTPGTQANSARKAKASAKKQQGTPKATDDLAKNAMVDSEDAPRASRARSASKAKATPRPKPSGKLRPKSARK